MINWEKLFGSDVWQTLSPGDHIDLIELVERNISANIVACSALTWAIYDTFLTIGRESRYVWSRKPAATTAIYVANLRLHSCRVQGIVGLVVFMLVYISQAAFSALRLFAIRDRSLKLAVFVFNLHIPPLILDVLWSPYRIPDAYLAIEYFPGCYLMYNSSYMIPLITAFILRRAMTLATDIIVLLLTWTKTYHIRREVRSFGINASISTLLLRDGNFTGFLDLCGAYMLRIPCPQRLRLDDGSTLLIDYSSLFLQVFRSITVCHFILHLREVYLTGSDENTSSPLASSFLQFASHAIGNLGAPLDLACDDDDAEDTKWVSRNPLAVGLPIMSEPEEHDALYQVARTSLQSTPEIKDVFDDDKYAQRYLLLVRRKNTGDELYNDITPETHSFLVEE
ncbi:uncharacterized protein PHACADRAFT_158552 [Phanerochaete carnosa HHB-10118-sp]|uniref:DUF6533 domain-containing protein n=1 Tax=Phanerochaete carnosa (strain HHB-10118-sp) TaxID=650164 RepID=K5V4E3_PHACS|nr:uncharacterized protein PHACADRAFT_158552 [Phanerochaete carnosa HHB-10118-sp]EKM57476.1 hypothetical protein PHACADRAFT_158552 [Phanerochaete carnosa HHB-10118-sp]